jgi:hypothetical protein
MWKKRRKFWELFLGRRKKAPPKEHFFSSIPDIQEFEKKYGYFSDHPLVGKVSSAKEDVDLVNELFSAIHPKFHSKEQRLFIAGELITKVLAYRDLKKGMQLFIPLDEKSQIFYVDKVFDLWNGMPAYGLTPEKKSMPPILLFRGTDLTFSSKRGLSSILSDLDLYGPGYSTFFRARPVLQKWLKQKAAHGKKARIMGFSLGGVLSSYVVLYEKDKINLDVPSMAFHTPGVHKKIFMEWNQIKETKQPPFLVFVHPNDVVSMVGTLLGSIFTLSSDPHLTTLSAHVSLLSAQNEFSCRGE